ncbi:MAG TPA: bifunctional [glutamate--ammonia ligase]-adenylyl-L-tyrosine phosphorylase/[glutamate--ammonia-ligase] adenylyltransferase [Rhodocyclaceae bacterium]|nr:bifunctional [glutamate--ammonia ligase]-adenylyl-L-tyrosine phosphorylase/[glutamate--ammonia-ligase] adenylyltransferase [Rhodocyclaceae bacterium]
MPNSPDPISHSRHLAQLLRARPELAAETDAGSSHPLTAGELAGWLARESLNENNLKPILRQLKQRAFARVAYRDLAGLAPLAEVMESMTLLAEAAIATATAVLGEAMASRYGTPRNPEGRQQKLVVIGMGKLGGRELNVSSDIDLIFVYPDNGTTDGARAISNFEFFTRLGRSLIAAISEINGDGQVFRVDMRLRPDGDSGPLVCSYDALENYFITQGREWERYAWIKARPLTGERHDELEALRRPFVFRKYLDFGAIDALRGLHGQIRREVARRDMIDNVKLGPGGIREIEFIAQVFQLIRGGRDLSLQIKPTLPVLQLLRDRGTLAADATMELANAYDFLRRLEHRLQYLDDAQTHSLPAAPEDRLRVARAMGYTSFEALVAELDDHRQNVTHHFESVFADRREQGHALDGLWQAPAEEGQAQELARLGFGDGAAACERLAGIRASARYQQLTEAARNRFDALVPRVIQAAAGTPAPDATLTRCLDLLEAISRRAAYLALLTEYPQALTKVAQIVGSSAWAAGYLQRHPVLLDEFLDPGLLAGAPDWPSFRLQLARNLDEAEPDTERQMDLMREAHHAQVFRLLAQDLSGLLPLEILSDHLTDLADAIVEVSLRLAWRKLLRRHVEEPRFAVIAYGKLGSKELGYASDLDLVFLHDDPAPEAQEIYSRLVSRLTTWLSAQTSAGQLFETDLRLRPNGDAGLAVTAMDAFRKYQLEDAWPWEHQALVRARFCAGDAAVGAAFARIRREILCQRRDPAKLREDVLAMRQKMMDNLATEAGERETVFDLKQDRGGLVDVEFIVQALVLGHAWQYPELTAHRGNIFLLRLAAEKGLIPADLATRVGDAYREYRRMQHALRLNNQQSHVAPAAVADKVAAVRELWQTVFDQSRSP